MSVHPITVRCGEKQFELKDGETVLDGATQQGVAIPSSCRSGLCHTCLVRVSAGDIPQQAQTGLSKNKILQNMALACQLRPSNDLTIELDVGNTRQWAEVIEHKMLNQRVLRLRLEFDISWFPGQYLTLWKNESVGRPYSIASLPQDGYVECHIRIYPQGAVSSWLRDEVKRGDTLQISEPIGDCFYSGDMDNKSILLIGYGTGLAPLYGIARDALQQHHSLPITLFVCVRDHQHFYYQQELAELSHQYQNFKLHVVVGEGNDPQQMFNHIKKQVLAQLPNLQNWCVFLCGAPELVKGLQKGCFLHGASMKDIHADPFISGQ